MIVMCLHQYETLVRESIAWVWQCDDCGELRPTRYMSGEGDE